MLTKQDLLNSNYYYVFDKTKHPLEDFAKEIHVSLRELNKTIREMKKADLLYEEKDKLYIIG